MTDKEFAKRAGDAFAAVTPDIKASVAADCKDLKYRLASSRAAAVLPRRRPYWAAAACLALAAALTLVIYKAAQKPENVTALVPTDIPAMPTAAPTETPRIVYGEETTHDSYVADAGEVRYRESLLKALNDSANNGCLFSVIIEYYPYEKYEAAENEQLAKWRALYVPIIAGFMDEYEAWKETYTPTDEDRMNRKEDAYSIFYYLHKMTEKTYGTDDPILEEALLERFTEVWKENNSSEAWDEFIAAKRAIDERWRTDKDPFDEEFRKDVFREESERLLSLGYPLDNSDEEMNLTIGGWRCLLTKEQIEAFPANRGDGYIFRLASDLFVDL